MSAGALGSWHPVRGGGLMHAHDTGEFEAAHEGDEPGRWIDVSVLSAVAVGASIEEIATRLGTGDSTINQDDVGRVIADLERRDLLRAGTGPEDASRVPTERGRRMILDQVGAWVAAAAELETERH